MTRGVSEQDRRRWQDAGLEPTAPESALATLESLLASGRANVAALTADWKRYADSTPACRALLSGISGGVTTSGFETSPELPQLMAATPSTRRYPVMLARVTDQIRAVAGLGPSVTLGPDHGLRDIGIDSLMSLELRNRLQRAAGVPLPSTLAFDHPTPHQLTLSLLERLGAVEPDREAATPDEAADETVAAEIDAMSDEEVRRMLTAEIEALALDRADLK
jgi:hypothetical protein